VIRWNFKLKNGKTITIREVQVSDAEKVVTYFKQVNLESKNLLREPEEVTMTIEQEIKFLENVVKSNDQCMLTAWDQDTLISLTGFHGSGLKRIKHKVSLGMSVLKDYYNQGLGTKMMNVLCEKAKEYGKTKIELDVRKDNPAAIRIYEKAGFEIEGLRKKAFFSDGEYVDLVLMGRTI
jgi:RimJ/RimL family protein N-acetyltransferase